MWPKEFSYRGMKYGTSLTIIPNTKTVNFVQMAYGLQMYRVSKKNVPTFENS